MRKYFLLSAVALMTATNVNAQTASGAYSASFNIGAKIERTKTATCNESLNFGTVYVTDGAFNNEYAHVVLSAHGQIMEKSEEITMLTGETSGAYCYVSADEFEDDPTVILENNSVQLINSEAEEYYVWVDNFSVDTDLGAIWIGGRLNIPAHISAGTFSGKVNVLFVY